MAGITNKRYTVNRYEGHWYIVDTTTNKRVKGPFNGLNYARKICGEFNG